MQFKIALKINMFQKFSLRIRWIPLRDKQLPLIRILLQTNCMSRAPRGPRGPPTERRVRGRRNLFFWLIHIHFWSPPVVTWRRSNIGSWSWSCSLGSDTRLSFGLPTCGRLITRGGRSVQLPNPPPHSLSANQLIRARFERLVGVLDGLVLPNKLLGALDTVQSKEDAEDDTEGSRQKEVQCQH